jgi:hypothetical protein
MKKHLTSYVGMLRKEIFMKIVALKIQDSSTDNFL